MPANIFITYTHLDEINTGPNRRRVAQYVATHLRNRSAPSSRRRLQSREQQRRRLAPAVDEQRNSQASLRSEAVRPTVIRSVPRDHRGLREDPFAVLPTQYNGALTVAVDYYIQSYAPAHLIRPELVTIENGTDLVHQHFQYAIQNPVMFESILALAYSNLAIIGAGDQAGERSVYHYGQAVSQLRLVLSQHFMEDAVLFAIMALMGVNYLWNDLSAFQSNLEGLRQIVALRGGLNALAWPTLLKPAILTLESFWTYLSYQTHLQDQYTLQAIAIDQPTVFENDAGALVSNLPNGFRVLVEQRRLNSHIARVIEREAEFDASLSRTPPTSFINGDGVRKFAHLRTRDGDEVNLASNLQTCEELARLLANPRLTQLEVICCVGMFINALCITRSEQLSPIYFAQVQHHAKQLIDYELTDDDPAAKGLVAWTIFNVASTMVPSRFSDLSNNHQNDMRLDLAIKIVKAFPNSTWEDIKSLLQRFICSDVCIVVFKNVWDIGTRYL